MLNQLILFIHYVYKDKINIDVDDHLLCGRDNYDKIYYLFLLTLHPQNKNRSIVLFPEQLKNIDEESLDLEQEIDVDEAVEDADVYLPV